MKKFFLTLSVVLIAAAAVADSTTVLLNQNFEGCNEGAALGQAGMVVSPATQWGEVAADGATIETVDGNKVLKVTQIEGAGQQGIAIPIDGSGIVLEPGNYLNITFKRFQVAGHMYGEFRLNANYQSTNTGDNNKRPLINFENNGTQLNFLNNGYDLSPDSQSGKTVEYPGAVTEDTWQEFFFSVELATGLVDFYIDGVRQSAASYQLVIKRCDGFAYLVFANGTGGADTTRPGVYYDDVKVEYVELSKKLVRSINFGDYDEGQLLVDIVPEWMTALGTAENCYITNLSFNSEQTSCLFLDQTPDTGFCFDDIEAEKYEGCIYVFEIGTAAHYFDGQWRCDIRNGGMTFWRFWDNWHWKTSFKVDGEGKEIQFGNDGPIDKWCKTSFIFDQDSTLYRVGRIDTGNMGSAYRAIGGYDFENSPDHTFGFTDDISGSVDKVAFYHGWWTSGSGPRFVSYANVYVLGVPEPGFLALGLIALVAFLRRR